MRLFEILLILVCVTDGSARIIQAHRRPFWLSILPLLAFLIGIIHAAGEGTRWQMNPVYVVVLATFTSALIRAFRSGETGEGSLARYSGILVLVPSLATIAAGTALPVYELPIPRGDYSVGVRETHLGPSVIAFIYYPTDKPSGTRASLDNKSVKDYKNHLATRYGIPVMALGHIGRLETHASEGASLSRELPRYRVLIAEPEADRPALHAISLAGELASRGFIVIVPSVYDSASTVDAIVEKLETLDPTGASGWLAERLDLARVGIYGFGEAGERVLEACVDGAFRAGATIGYTGPISSTPTPLLVFRPEDAGDPPIRAVEETTYIVAARGMLAGNFSDDALVSPLMPVLGEFGTIDPYRASAITGAYVGAFFNKHLTRGTVEHLMDGPSNDYPEVTIQIHDAEE